MWDRKGKKEGISKKQKEISEDNGYIHYLDYNKSFMSIYLDQNLSNYILEMCTV
jgi:hypothetical protein